MEVPDGFRAEIIRGNIVMSPWSRGFYMPVMRSLRSQLEPHAPEGDLVDAAPFLFAFPGQERVYGPDLYVVAEAAFDTQRQLIDGEALTLVAELTSSSTRDADWDDKVCGYGAAGVPVYLLLEMQQESATVFSEPSAKGYEARATVPFGKTLRLPSPFDCDIDTAGFARHRGEAR
jgi:Uma2 family endonuclease